MSLARALTKRMRSHEDVSPSESAAPSRAFSTRRFDKPIDRSKISLPLELISSSNALAYEAPDIQQMQAEMAQQHESQASPSSSASSRKSYEDSVSSPGLSSASSVTSHESSPISATHKQATSFFLDHADSPPASAKESPIAITQAEEDTPNVPQRALSHTKHTHQALARQRSQRVTSPPAPVVSKPTPATRNSLDMFSSKPDADHPFGAELAKVNELAEEFGMKNVQIVDEESQYLIDNGFHCFSAEDYMAEIQPLFASAFPAPVTWL